MVAQTSWERAVSGPQTQLQLILPQTPKQAEQHDNDQALSVSTQKCSLRFGYIWGELYL